MVGDGGRLELHRLLEERLGPRAAGLLMDQLPPVGWPELATKADLAQLGARLRIEMAEFRADIRTELRTEIAGVRSELAGIRVELAGVKAGVVEVMNQQLTKLTWVMLTLMVTFIAAAFAVTHAA